MWKSLATCARGVPTRTVSLEGELIPQRQAPGLLSLCVPSASHRVVIKEV